MTTPFTLPDTPLAPVAGSEEKFPIRRIFCVGANYAKHAKEMGRDPERDPPFFFTKWAETFVENGGTVPYPQGTENFHFEAELVVAIDKTARNISADEAGEIIYGYATGLDMTRRDLQLQAREKGRPWDTGKNVEASAPMGAIHKVADIGHPTSGRIALTVNGETKQDGDLTELIWPVTDLISFLSKLYQLEPGDLVYTGTPAGVGPVVEGDTLVVTVEGLSDLTVTIGSPVQ